MAYPLGSSQGFVQSLASYPSKPYLSRPGRQLHLCSQHHSKTVRRRPTIIDPKAKERVARRRAASPQCFGWGGVCVGDLGRRALSTRLITAAIHVEIKGQLLPFQRDRERIVFGVRVLIVIGFYYHFDPHTEPIASSPRSHVPSIMVYLTRASGPLQRTLAYARKMCRARQIISSRRCRAFGAVSVGRYPAQRILARDRLSSFARLSFSASCCFSLVINLTSVPMS